MKTSQHGPRPFLEVHRPKRKLNPLLAAVLFTATLALLPISRKNATVDEWKHAKPIIERVMHSVTRKGEVRAFSPIGRVVTKYDKHYQKHDVFFSGVFIQTKTGKKGSDELAKEINACLREHDLKLGKPVYPLVKGSTINVDAFFYPLRGSGRTSPLKNFSLGGEDVFHVLKFGKSESIYGANNKAPRQKN